ncbi:hypothetical protein GWI33_005459 [Rhynchophorus ferrugineus]|uniref:Uncharacterized protein n=1 Tax=Rhynchophorus ferrugineus TaxID=354439 RepID=A0A834MJL3_RHYFE|nr:hypothetical protein GWI33_005459 [Rhynchophorus ferrugineus]
MIFQFHIGTISLKFILETTGRIEGDAGKEEGKKGERGGGDGAFLKLKITMEIKRAVPVPLGEFNYYPITA